MRFDKLPIAEGLVGFLLVVLVATFIIAGEVIGTPDEEGEPTETTEPTDGSNGDGDGELTLTMTDNKFDKTGLTVPAGAEVSIALQNDGGAIHNVQVADGEGKYPAAFCTAGGPTPCSKPPRLNGGAAGTLEFNLPAGDYPFRCDFHPVEMTGTITVK